MNQTGANILIEVLKEEGVEVIFGYPGANTLPIHDRLMDSDIRHYTMRHEQAAAHAADGYARATGKVGVCLSTSGPGATNLVTGIATAFMDSTPLVAITGQVTTNLLGRDAFQETDIIGITMPITKHSFLVNQVNNVPSLVRQAFHLARTGRPGPILLDIPKDVMLAPFAGEEKVTPTRKAQNGKGEDQDQLARIARAINLSQRPLIIIGGGIKLGNACEEMGELIKKAQIPYATTMMGLGSAAGADALNLGLLGTHGQELANRMIHQADFILAVGVRFTDRTTPLTEEFAPLATVAQIDIDPTSIGKNLKIDLPYVGDVSLALRAVISLLNGEKKTDWLKRIERERANAETNCPDNGCGRPGRFVAGLQEALPKSATVVADVGLNQIWTVRSWHCRTPRSLITSGGMGTMGFSLPAAIGAKVGTPEREVVSISGDGGFLMNIQELATIAYYRLPVKIVVMNNGQLGMVRQLQDLFYDGRMNNVDLGAVDLVAVAKGFGIPAGRILEDEEPERGIEALRQAPGPYLLEVRIDPKQYVYPIVAPGGTNGDMIFGR